MAGRAGGRVRAPFSRPVAAPTQSHSPTHVDRRYGCGARMAGISEAQPQPRFTIFVHLTALPAWLALERTERQQIIAEHVQPLLIKHDAVHVRWFDAEAWVVSPSDVLVAATYDLTAWSDLFEGLRDSPLWSVPYFRVELVLPTVEDGFADYERRTGQRD